MNGASAIIRSCQFEGNDSTDGGGIRISGGSPMIENCSFNSNYASA